MLNLKGVSFIFVLLNVWQDSLDYFGERRTDKSMSSKFQGVETPSQVSLSCHAKHCVQAEIVFTVR